MSSDFSHIKAIAFDLDDTVLMQGELSCTTATALAAAAEKGIALIPVSGRAFATIPESILALPGVTYAVTSNGAAVYEVKTGQRTCQTLMEASAVRKTMRSVGNYFLEGQITYEAYVNGVAYASADFVRNPTSFRLPKSAVPYIQSTRRPERFIIDFIFDHAKEMDGLGLILKEPGLFRMIESAILRSTDSVKTTSAVPYRLEISAKDATKATGLTQTLALLGLTPAETLAFGDGDNDADMLALAGIGVALSNATAACKAKADHITAESCGNDGVAGFLRENLL